jgi:hypothetical protein
MSASFTVEGMENLQRIFREFPENGYRKPVIAAFRKAAEPVKRAMIANLPGNLKSLRKAIKIKPGKGKSMTLAVGIYARQGVFRNSRGQDWDPYQIAYWHNYGTLANRYSQHSFVTPRRKTTARFKGGIKPLLFVEKAWEESKGQAQKEFEKKADEEITKFLEKNAYKG